MGKKILSLLLIVCTLLSIIDFNTKTVLADVVNTGDTNNQWLWLLLLVISVVGVIILLFMLLRKKKNK